MKNNDKVMTKAPHGTQEWAAHNINIQHGCENNCKYCYAKSFAIRFGRSTPDTWATTEFQNDKIEKEYRKRDGKIMFPTSHDITDNNINEYISVLKKLLVSGNDVLIVSKPHLSCIKRICEECSEYKKQILFRFTIGSTSNRVLKYWEPEAPTFNERLNSLKWAHTKGYQTSVSVEPMLDTNMDELIKALRPYVTDSIWLGRVNNIKAALTLNCPKDTDAKKKAEELLEQQNDQWINLLYRKYHKDKIIKWKDSIKKVVGIERPTEKGMDI